MGFDVIPNPTEQVLMMPAEPVESGTSTSPGSLPGLSRSNGTTSTVSPNSDFPVLPILRRCERDQEDGVDGQDEADDWDMVQPDNDAWVGIETGRAGESTGDNTDDELIFMDEESLMGLRNASQDQKLANDGNKGMKGKILNYAGIVKA
jgi:hypothetical protein